MTPATIAANWTAAHGGRLNAAVSTSSVYVEHERSEKIYTVRFANHRAAGYSRSGAHGQTYMIRTDRSGPVIARQLAAAAAWLKAGA